MVMSLYSICDSLAEEFAPPFLSKNLDTALRSVKQLLAKYPDVSGMSLYHVGTFDMDDGKLSLPEGGLPVFCKTLDNSIDVSSVVNKNEVAQ